METNDPFLKKWGLRNWSQKARYDNFVLHYLETGSAVTAYKRVFEDTKNTKILVHKVLKHPYIVYLIQKKNKELEKKMDKKIINNRERIISELDEILRLTKDDKKYNAALKALDQLSKICGVYSPEKQEIEHKGITVNYIKPDKSKDKK